MPDGDTGDRDDDGQPRRRAEVEGGDDDEAVEQGDEGEPDVVDAVGKLLVAGGLLQLGGVK